MKYRRLGKTDLNVSVIGVGTWQFGGEWGLDFSQEAVDQILDKAKDFGINLIDTAECYGDHLSEQLIGGYLKKPPGRLDCGDEIRASFSRQIFSNQSLWSG